MSSIEKFGEPFQQIAAEDMLRLPYDRVSRCKILEKNKLKLYYTIMLGGCIYLYSNETDKKWKRVISLKQVDRITRLNPDSGPAKDKFCVELLHLSVGTRKKGSEKCIISANDERDRKEWMMALFRTLLIYHGLDKSKDDIQKFTYLELEESITDLRKQEKLKDEGTGKRDVRYSQFPCAGRKLTASTSSHARADKNVGYEPVALSNKHVDEITDKDGTYKSAPGKMTTVHPVEEVMDKGETYENVPDKKLSQPVIEVTDKDKRLKRVKYERTSQPSSETSTTSGAQHREPTSASGHTAQDAREKNVSGKRRTSSKQKRALAGAEPVRINIHADVVSIHGTASVKKNILMETIYANTTSSSSEVESPVEEFADKVDTYENVTDEGTLQPNKEMLTTTWTQHRELASASSHTTQDIRQQNVPGQHQISQARKEYKKFMFHNEDPEAAKACLQDKPKGTFLIQKTKDRNKMALVVKHEPECARFDITKDGDKFVFIRKFENLQHLVERYQQNTFKRNGEQFRLEKGYKYWE